MDPRNIWYGGTTPNSGWAQILRLEAPTAGWRVDLEMPRHVRPEILQSVTFTTNGRGEALGHPATLLLASAFEGGGEGGISLFTRNDATGQWEQSKIIPGPTGKRGEANSVRAMRVHRDTVTGVDRLFISIGELGVFSGVYDPDVRGSIRWDRKSESGPLATRPLAIIEANGALLFSTGSSILQRVDGPVPRFVRVYHVSDSSASEVESPVGGIRGLTAIPSPTRSGESLLFVWTPGKRSRGCVVRLEPDGTGGYQRIDEPCLDNLVSRYLTGNPVYFVLAGYNALLPIQDPITGEVSHIIGLEAWIGGARFPTMTREPRGGYYAGALYAIRDGKGNYRLGEVNGQIPWSNRPLVATRAYVVSPFADERGQVIYFGGYDCNFVRASDTAWVFKTDVANVLRASQ